MTPDTDTRILLNIKGDYGDCQLDLVVWVTGVNDENNSESCNKNIAVFDDQYKLLNSLENVSDVGYLAVQVIQAMGLGSPKIQGNSMHSRMNFIHCVWKSSNFVL